MSMEVWGAMQEDEELADQQRGKLEMARGIFCGLIFTVVAGAIIFVMACL